VAEVAQGKLPVFICWSLPLSEQIASILRQWLEDVVPSIAPWFSGDDIETGKFWRSELFKSLDRSTVGIVIVTPTNVNRPWLNFEAGRLSSGIESKGGVVMPLLVNLESADITNTPLSTLNVVTFSESGVWKIVKAIHERTGNDMAEKMLKNLFDLNWAELSAAVTDAIAQAVANDPDNAKPEQRNLSDVLEDLIVTVNEVRQDVRGGGDSMGQWSAGLNANAVYQEVLSILRPSGIVPADIRITDIHRNGVIYLEIDLDGPFDERTVKEVQRRVRKAPRYHPTVRSVEAGAPVVVSNRGGSRVVGPTSRVVVHESDDNQA
jgi:hypothetical protein